MVKCIWIFLEDNSFSGCHILFLTMKCFLHPVYRTKINSSFSKKPFDLCESNYPYYSGLWQQRCLLSHLHSPHEYLLFWPEANEDRIAACFIFDCALFCCFHSDALSLFFVSLNSENMKVLEWLIGHCKLTQQDPGWFSGSDCSNALQQYRMLISDSWLHCWSHLMLRVLLDIHCWVCHTAHQLLGNSQSHALGRPFKVSLTKKYPFCVKYFLCSFGIQECVRE